MTWVVAGLGNPGERYAATRHNLGVRVVETLASRSGERLRKVRFLPVEAAEIRIAERQRVIAARSTQFMNVSGPGFASLARRHRVPPDHIIACHDEIDLPFGALRVKKGGSTAGHQGLNSLVGALRTPEFLRVRMGVGRPPGRQDPADYVLQSFSKREEPDIEILIEDATDAVLSLVTDGLAATQDRYNRAGPAR